MPRLSARVRKVSNTIGHPTVTATNRQTLTAMARLWRGIQVASARPRLVRNAP